MTRLVTKILAKTPARQDDLWLCADSGGEWDKKNIWLMAQTFKLGTL